MLLRVISAEDAIRLSLSWLNGIAAVETRSGALKDEGVPPFASAVLIVESFRRGYVRCF